MEHYCYEVQAWIARGRVLACGHSTAQRGCFACAQAGAAHTCAKCTTTPQALEAMADAAERAVEAALQATLDELQALACVTLPRCATCRAWARAGVDRACAACGTQ